MSTIRDVAKLAGVAPSTVSHVFHDTAPISESTRKRVLHAAEKLCYEPRRRGRTAGGLKKILMLRNMPVERQAVGTPLEDVNLSDMVVSAAWRYLKQRDFHCVIAPFDIQGIPEDMKALQFRGFVGALVVDDSVKTFTSIPEMGLPTVLAYCVAESRAYRCIVPDDFRGGYDATRHLIDHGHRRIAFISGPETYLPARSRSEGYITALHEGGIHPAPELMERGSWTIDSGRDAVARLLEKTSFTALFAANDLMAFGAMQVLKQRNYRIPEDVAVVGFDNRMLSAYCDPPLTTVELPLEAIGRRSAAELLTLIESGDHHADELSARVQIHCPLVVRQSCGIHSSDQ